MLKKMIAALIPLSLALLVSAAQAATSAGTVLVATGTSIAKSASGELRTLARGGAIEEGDTINTGPGAKLSLRMKDQALITLNQNSEFTVNKYQFKGDGDKKDQASLKLSKGSLLTMTGQMEKAGYQLETPVSTLGIRGTIYEVIINDDGTTTYNVVDGEIILLDKNGNFFAVPAGKSITTDTDGLVDATSMTDLSDDTKAAILDALEGAQAGEIRHRHIGDKHGTIMKNSAGTRDDAS